MVLGNANGIDLNNDTLYRISRVGGLGVTLATRIVRNRPLRRWSDLEKIEGFDEELVNDLRGSGAVLGRPQITKASAPSGATTRQHRVTERQPAQVVGKPAKSTSRRRAKNIFSGEGNALE